MRNKKTIFIFAYYSLKDPVFQSAVLPYFTSFPDKEKFRFVLLTFEQKKYALDKSAKEILKAKLAEDNIIWYSHKWHSGRFKLVKKIYDMMMGFIISLYIIFRFRASLIYSEAFPGAIISHIVAIISFRSHIVHSYEPHTDYMVEGGTWKKNSWEAILLRYFEKAIARKAHTVMTATSAYAAKLREWGVKNIVRVPSCVDLVHFQFKEADRIAIRNQLGLTADQIVVAYLGKTGGMYWDQEIFQFFNACLKQSSRFYFFFFTPEDIAVVAIKCREYGIPEDAITIKFLSREEVPSWLSAADFGLSAVKQYPSKRYCSPIKNGEYWACGLPLLTPVGVSDDYQYADQYKIGVTIKSTTLADLETGAKEVLEFYNQNSREQVKKNARSFVESDRDVRHYQRIFRDIFLSV